MSYRYILLIIVPLIVSNYISDAQTIAYDYLPGDTTIKNLNKSVLQSLKVLSEKSQNEFETSAKRYSLSGKLKLHKTIFNPLSLRYEKIEPVSLPRQMNDGTYWLEESNINKTRLFYVLGSMAAVDLALYIYQRGVWRQEHTNGFHSINWWVDIHNYQRMDKIGHFLDAYFVSDLTAKLYRWSGVSGESSIWFGAMTGWLWMLEIEISDGFFADWGFSWLDLSANTLGSGFFILQQYYPEALGGLHPKISYHVSDAWKDKTYTKNPKSLIDDYEGMTFWLAINPYHYFPDSWKKDYPKWLAPLGIAIGYGAEGIAPFPQYGKPEWYLGLDFDLSKMPIGNDSGILKFIKSEFNFLRLPLPAIRFTPSGIWYGFYF